MVGAAATGMMKGHFATAAMWLIAHPWVWSPGTAALAATTFFIMFNGKKVHPLMAGPSSRIGHTLDA
jgi:SulP family sulfate permease